MRPLELCVLDPDRVSARLRLMLACMNRDERGNLIVRSNRDGE